MAAVQIEWYRIPVDNFFWRHWWVAMVIACYLHSVFHPMVGMSDAVHELNHGTVFRTRRINSPPRRRRQKPAKRGRAAAHQRGVPR